MPERGPAHESENLDGNRIVFGFCIRLTRRLQSITHLMYNANSGADAATLHALRLTRHHSESSPTTQNPKKPDSECWQGTPS
jgi:hypothetical protein